MRKSNKAVAALAAAGLGLLSGCEGKAASGAAATSHVVATHVAGASRAVAWFLPDGTDAMTDSIPGAELIGGPLGTAGALYGVRTSTPGVYSEVGIAHATGHLVLASAAGHTYQLLGIAAGRPVFADSVANAAPFDVVSFGLDGTGRKALLSGCASIGFGIFQRAGLSMDCPQGTVHTEYYSDGVHPGIALPEDPDPAAPKHVPTFVTSSRVFFDDLSGATVRAIAQTFDGSSPTDVLGTGTTGTTEVLAVGAAKIAIQRVSASSQGLRPDLFMCNTDGTTCVLESTLPPNTYTSLSGRIDPLYGVSSDGHSFLYNRGDVAIVYRDDGVNVTGTDVSGTIFGGSAISSSYFLPGDTHVLHHLTSVSNLSSTVWQTVEVATQTANVITLSAPFVFLASRPGYALMFDGAAHELATFSVASASRTTLSTSALPNALFGSDLSVIWNEQDGSTRLSNAARSLSPRAIDTAPSIGLQDAGRAADGRIFFASERSPTDYDTMVVTPASGSARLVAGTTSSDLGFFFP
jgi:hypothetical protein